MAAVLHRVFAMKVQMKMSLVAFLVAALAACAPTHKGDSYSRDELGSSVVVHKGTVIGTRVVKVEGTSTIGTVAGAVAGGALGSQAGGNDAVSIAVGVAGAVVGGVLGSAAERKLTEGEALEVIVRHDGKDDAVAIIQDGKERFQPGQRVLVLYSDRIRVTADPQG